MGETIAVLSGKGGTGKTSVCAALGTALASDGLNVLCIDCDLGLQNLDISLGMADSGALSFLELCRGGYQLEQAAVHPAFPSLRFLTAPVARKLRQGDQDSFRALLRQARQEFDFVLLDAPAGIDSGFELAARYADRVVVVTLADRAAVRDATRAGQLLWQMGKRDVRLVVNRANAKLFAGMGVTVDDVMDEAGLPLLGVVPEDRNVTLAAAFGMPLIKKTKRGAAKACIAIARRLQGKSVPLTIEN